MTKTLVLEGRSFTLRGLKRGEVKQLRTEFPDGGSAEEVDRILELVGIDVAELDDLQNASVLQMYYAVLDLTFPRPDAVKNFSAPSA